MRASDVWHHFACWLKAVRQSCTTLIGTVWGCAWGLPRRGCGHEVFAQFGVSAEPIADGVRFLHVGVFGGFCRARAAAVSGRFGFAYNRFQVSMLSALGKRTNACVVHWRARFGKCFFVVLVGMCGSASNCVWPRDLGPRQLTPGVLALCVNACWPIARTAPHTHG